MTRQLYMAGKNSNEIYTLLYPNNIINFCKYDFTPFLNHCVDLCRLASRTGEYNVEDVYSIRNSISGCHKYYEQNMRTVFEKIVIDCWIEYLCKQSEASASALWQSFMRCRNDFERAVFARLSEYRHNHAINEWSNLLRLQEYARTKMDFVFGIEIENVSEAAARANYFDLMFNVGANEQGFPVSEISAASIYSAGRVPNSPFILSSASREIVRNVLNGMEDANIHYKAKTNPDLSDQTAMDAFSVIKSYIPDKNDSLVKTIIKSMSGSPQRVYMPRSFKSVIDLEIDAIIESKGFLQRCRKCGEFFLKDDEYPYDYCSRVQKDGTICLDYAEAEVKEAIPIQKAEAEPIPVVAETKQLDKTYINDTLEALYKEMAARVNVDLTQRDFSRWYQRDLRLKGQLLLGQAGEDELRQFIELSRGDEFASKKQAPVVYEREEEKPIAVTETGKEVKRFVFERVERLADQPKSAPAAQESLAASEQAANEAVRRLFASQNPQAMQIRTPPPVQNYYAPPSQYGYHQQYGQPIYPQPPQYQPQQKPVSRIIRGGAANTGYKERPFDTPLVKPKTVVIPNGQNEQKPAAPSAPVRNEDDDVKVFTPRRPSFISNEPSPFEEKIRQPLEEYRRNREEEEEPQITGQISADEVIPEPSAPVAPAASAKAISAYRTLTLPNIEDSEKKLEKADFSGVLEGLNRNDGFRDSEIELDSEGLPVSHKTQHVMNALFGPTRVSPFLKINLDDEDDN